MKQFAEVTNDDIELEYKKIASNVKKLREDRKITQEELALAMGFTTATFYTNAENFKQGKHFNLEHLIKISKYFDIPINKIFE